ncbi:MAG: hybrid sensor histidine kinase/response regulator [Ignavibacteriaceae bacterium]
MDKLQILHLEDNLKDAIIVEEEIKSEGIEADFTLVSSEDKFSETLENQNFNLILSDYSLAGFSGESALKIASTKYPDIPFIFVSGTIGEERAVELLKNGATDYVIKDNLKRLVPVINRALNEAEVIKRKQQAEKDLIEAKEKAEMSDRLKSEFLAQMSHEIRTPLNAILNYTSLLKMEFENKVDESLNFIFNSIDSSGRRLIRTVDLVLNMSAIQTGIYELQITSVNLAELLRKIMNEFYSHAASTGVSLKLDLNPDIKPVSGDEYTIYQIFQNLIDNAIKFTEKGSVEVKLYTNKNGKVCAEVKDTGIGISEEYMPNLFKSFSQESKGYSRKFEGNGLGLALTKKYTDLNKAEITVKSKKGEGSTFTVSFME